MPDNILAPALLADIRGMIDEARAAVAATVNAGLTLLYWRIGKRINDEVLQGERAEYGRETIFALGRQLVNHGDMVVYQPEKLKVLGVTTNTGKFHHYDKLSRQFDGLQ